MRNSRKYINPSINGSRNIFTSYDEVPGTFNLQMEVLPPGAGFENSTNTITIQGLTVPVFFRLAPTIGGSFHASSYCKVFKNGNLIQTINTPSSFPATDITEPFYNGDTLRFSYYTNAFTILSYTMRIYRYEYTIINPKDLLSSSIDTISVDVS